MTFARTPPPSVVVSERSDGSILLRSGLALPPPPLSLAHLFDEQADEHPQRPFMKQRDDAGGWRAITYADARRAANGLAQWLIDQGLGIGDHVSYLSEPSIEHGIAALGVQRCGAALAPISVAYSLLSDDHERLRECVRVVGARVVIVSDAQRYGPALHALADMDVIFVAVCGASPDVATVRWEKVVATEPTRQVAERMAAVRPDMVARVMYTSGSTGSPKATPQRHANLNVTIAQLGAINLLDFDGEAPQHLESMPFSHIMAGNYNFGNVIRAGGTIWIDEGKPTPALFGRTLENLRDVSPHYFITVPLGCEMLCEAMEADEALRDGFFHNLRFIGFGGATLAESVARRLRRLSQAATGAEVPIFCFYGATEFLLGTIKYWPQGNTDVIGLPLPGTELKLVPVDDRFELRVRGPTLMPRSGYIGASQASDTLFDAEGFLTTGDAVRFADAADPARGLVFAGRLVEDFKLASGTFVSATCLRQDLLDACAPLVSDVVLCGINQDYVGALLWARGGAGQGDPAIRAAIAAFNARQTGSARRIGAALVLGEPLSFDHGELTDKGSVAARVVRQRRADDVDRLFAAADDPAILRFDARAEHFKGTVNA